MTIVLALDDEFFEGPVTMKIANFMLWTLDHKPFRKGPMRERVHYNAQRGNPHFARFREAIGRGKRGKRLNRTVLKTPAKPGQF